MWLQHGILLRVVCLCLLSRGQHRVGRNDLVVGFSLADCKYSWGPWSANCTETFTTYPRTLPANTNVQSWAYLPLTVCISWFFFESLVLMLQCQSNGTLDNDAILADYNTGGELMHSSHRNNIGTYNQRKATRRQLVLFQRKAALALLRQHRVFPAPVRRLPSPQHRPQPLPTHLRLVVPDKTTAAVATRAQRMSEPLLEGLWEG